MAFPLETIIQDGILSVLGNDIILAGVGVIAFFVAISLWFPTHPGVKGIVIFGGAILAIPLVGWAWTFISFGAGLLMFFAARRFWG